MPSSCQLAADEAHALLMLIMQAESVSCAYNLAPRPYGSGRPDVNIAPLLGAGGQALVDEYMRGLFRPLYVEFSDAQWRACGSGAVELTADQAADLLSVVEYSLEVTLDDHDPADGDVEECNGFVLHLPDARAAYTKLTA